MKQVLPEALLLLLSPYTLSPLLCPNRVPSETQCQQVEEALLTLMGRVWCVCGRPSETISG